MFKSPALFYLIVALVFLASSFCVSAQTFIDSCNQTLNTSNTVYQLNQSINVSGGANCLNITAANVTLDCMGFTINSSAATGVGIFLLNADNSTIRNCRIEFFNISILPQNSDGLLIVNNTLMNATTAGIFTVGMSDSTIENNTIVNVTGATSDSYGILFTNSSSGNTIRNNSFLNNTAVGANVNYGIMFENLSTSNNVIGNFLFLGEFGIYDTVGSNNMSNNIIRNNTVIGIVNNGSDSDVIVNNTVIFNNDGIFLINSSTNTLRDNNASNNTRYGIKIMDGSTGNNLTGDTASGNQIGIYVLNAPTNNIVNATANQNTNASYAIANSLANTLTTSTASLSLNGLLLINGTNTTVTECTFDNSTNTDVFLNSTGCSFSDVYLDYFYDANFTTNTYFGTFNITGTDYTNTTLLYNATIKNLTHFVNITNTTLGAWMVLNMSYKPRDAFNIREASIKMYHWNGTNYTNITGSTIDVTNNVVSANLTSFSAFGPLGDSIACGWINATTTLQGDLYNAGRCLRIGANNVVLNCNNHGIWGRLVSQGINITNKVNVTIRNCLIYNFSSGIMGDNVTNSTFINNTANINTVGYNLTNVTTSNFTASIGSQNVRGLALIGNCSNNTFENVNFTANTLHGIHMLDNSSPFNVFRTVYINGSGTFDLRLVDPATSNGFYDITVGPTLTTFSFNQYVGNVSIKGVTASPAAAPSGKRSISKFLNITKTDGWVVMNISYTRADVYRFVFPDTLLMYRYTGAAWNAVTPASTVFTLKRVVTANLSAFSDFGLFGDPYYELRGGGGSNPGTGPNIAPTTTTEEEQVAPPSKAPEGNSYSQEGMQDTGAQGVYASRDDLMDTRAGVGTGAAARGLSTASIVALVIAVIAIGLFAAYIVSPKKKSRK